MRDGRPKRHVEGGGVAENSDASALGRRFDLQPRQPRMGEEDPLSYFVTACRPTARA